ncbi:MAG: hypothetical protein ACSLFE_09890, partial [Gemmatimonadaceae bacterium]
MKTTLIATALAMAFVPGASAQQSLQWEVLISTLPPADLAKQLASATGTIEHRSEVARGGPVAAVVRTTGCSKEDAGGCTVNVVVYAPDGSVLQEVKDLALPTGRASVPLEIDADSATGVYKVAIRVRDLTARRFGT